jgi:hypothetical protein
MENSVEIFFWIFGLIVSIVSIVIPIYFSIKDRKIKKNKDVNNDQIIKKELILKTWNEIKNVSDRYGILVPKSKYSRDGSFDYSSNIVKIFKNNNIIYQSVKKFFDKFEDNWDDIDKISTASLRKELEKLEIE